MIWSAEHAGADALTEYDYLVAKTGCYVRAEYLPPISGESSLHAHIASASDTRDSAYAGKDVFGASGTASETFLRAYFAARPAQTFTNKLTLAEVRDTAGALVYRLWAGGANNIVWFESPIGALDSGAILLPTETALSTTSHCWEVRALKNSAVEIHVDAQQVAIQESLSGGTAGNQRYLNLGAVYYEGTDTAAKDIYCYHPGLQDEGTFWGLAPQQVTSGDDVEVVATVSQNYITLEELKATLELSGKTFADSDLAVAITAASRAIDDIAHRRFYPDANNTQVRYYTANGGDTVEIDDLVTLGLSGLQTDYDGDGTYETSWTANTDYVLEPLNAAADGRPYERVRVLTKSSNRLSGYPRGIKVTGQFGWPTVPAGVKQATTIVASRYLRRAREAPFGIVSLGPDGEAIRIARTDPDVASALAPVMRSQVLA